MQGNKILIDNCNSMVMMYCFNVEKHDTVLCTMDKTVVVLNHSYFIYSFLLWS